MSDKHQVERDIILTFDFLRYIVDHPEMIEDIPDGSEIEFIGSEIITTESTQAPAQGKNPTIITTKRIFELLPSSQPSSAP